MDWSCGNSVNRYGHSALPPVEAAALDRVLDLSLLLRQPLLDRAAAIHVDAGTADAPHAALAEPADVFRALAGIHEHDRPAVGTGQRVVFLRNDAVGAIPARHRDVADQLTIAAGVTHQRTLTVPERGNERTPWPFRR